MSIAAEILRLDVAASIDLLYETVDEALQEGRFSDVDALIEALPGLSIEVAIGVLTITWAAADHLRARASYLQGVRERLIQDGDDPDFILHGLA